MKLPIYQIDAFTEKVFGGNPAAVVPLKYWLSDDILQQIAAENNVSETAFFVDNNNEFEIRWFTPKSEVDLCGHATLATAYVVFNYIRKSADEIKFTSKSGRLRVIRSLDLLTLDFPVRRPDECKFNQELADALGGNPIEMLKSRDYFVVYNSEDEIRELNPDFEKLKNIDSLGVIVTAKGDDCDFVSRFFAPNVGINEDPVTGSAHSSLIPYWSDKLAKDILHAYQLSERIGELFCEFKGDRVLIAGKVQKYLEGHIFVDVEE